MLNALHVLARPARAAASRRRRAACARSCARASAPPSAAELASWQRLPPGALAISRGRRAPGQPERRRGVLRAHRRATVARRQRDRRRRAANGGARRGPGVGLAAPGRGPGSASGCARCIEGLVRAALPAGAELELSFHVATPVLFDPGEPALRARGAGARARVRRRAGVRALGRQHPDRRRDGGARLPRDRRRLRPARGRAPRAG